MALKQKAEHYFSSLNPMANRICVDMNETKLSYDKLWDTLPYEEQQQILTQTIIKPEISLKYGIEDEDLEQVQDYAVKMIIDDNYSYRDEHSGPFSFRTQSQQDLSLLSKKTTPKKPLKKIVPPKAMKVIIKIPKTALVTPKVVPILPKVVLSKVNNAVKVVPEKIVQKVAPPQESLDEDDGDSTSLSHILPKTGLDLLDNW